MVKTSRLAAIAILWLCASPVFADPAPVTAPAAAPGLKTPNIQFGIPGNVTLAQIRKQAHDKAATLDKLTPEQWDAGQKDFHTQMENISKLAPEEQQRLFPGVPPEVLSHMGHAGMPQPGQPKMTPAESLARARKNAHARAEKYDQMTQAEWDERVQRNHDAVQKYKNLKDDQDKHAMLDRLLHQQQQPGAAAPATPTLGQSKIPAGKQDAAHP